MEYNLVVETLLGLLCHVLSTPWLSSHSCKIPRKRFLNQKPQHHNVHEHGILARCFATLRRYITSYNSEDSSLRHLTLKTVMPFYLPKEAKLFIILTLMIL